MSGTWWFEFSRFCFSDTALSVQLQKTLHLLAFTESLTNECLDIQFGFNYSLTHDNMRAIEEIQPQTITEPGWTCQRDQVYFNSDDSTEQFDLDREGNNSSWGRTMQCRKDRKVSHPTDSVPSLTSKLSSSEGGDRNVQNIIESDGWVLMFHRESGRKPRL